MPDLSPILGYLMSPVVLLAIAFFLREHISNYLAKRVAFSFKKEIEQFKSELIKNQDELRARLNERASELDAIRASVLSARGSRLSVLDKKRLESVEMVFQRVERLSRFTGLIAMFRILKLAKFENMSIDSDLQARKETFNTLSEGFNIDEELKYQSENPIGVCRLYVSPKAWTYYSVYHSIIMAACAQTKVFAIAIDLSGSMNWESIKEMTLKALPDSAEGFDKFGDSWLFYQTDILYEKLVDELKHLATSDDFDLQDMKVSSEISMMIAKQHAPIADIPDSLRKKPN